MQFFDHIYVGDEKMLEPWYFEKYKDRWLERSFGYWQWKPYLIRRVMDRMEEGDFLVYADAGCTLNPRGIPRLKEYLHMVEENPCGVLGFDQHFDTEKLRESLEKEGLGHIRVERATETADDLNATRRIVKKIKEMGGVQ